MVQIRVQCVCVCCVWQPSYWHVWHPPTLHAHRFFGGGFGGFGFGGGQEQEEQTPKGADVVLFLSVSLRDLYVGRTFKVCVCFAVCDCGMFLYV